MPVRTVTQSAANAADGSLLDELAGAYNDLAARFAALLLKLDDEGSLSEDFDAEIGEPDTIAYRGRGAPS
jgi:hypothetical protein